MTTTDLRCHQQDCEHPECDDGMPCMHPGIECSQNITEAPQTPPNSPITQEGDDDLTEETAEALLAIKDSVTEDTYHKIWKATQRLMEQPEGVVKDATGWRLSRESVGPPDSPTYALSLKGKRKLVQGKLRMSTGKCSLLRRKKNQLEASNEALEQVDSILNSPEVKRRKIMSGKKTLESLVCIF